MSGWYDNGRVYHIELSLQAVSPPAGDEIVVDKKAKGPFPRNVGSYRLGTSFEGRERELSLCSLHLSSQELFKWWKQLFKGLYCPEKGGRGKRDLTLYLASSHIKTGYNTRMGEPFVMAKVAMAR